MAAERIGELREIIAHCLRCDLSKSRTNAVFGDLNVGSPLILVGEAPGRDEDLQGRPFVGAAGRILNRALEEAGMTREMVSVLNVVKCRPPGNRPPKTWEIEACAPYLWEQLAMARPRLVVTMGRVAAKGLTGEDIKLSEVRGKVLEQEYPILVTYHPAYILRRRDILPDLVEDLRIAKSIAWSEEALS